MNVKVFSTQMGEKNISSTASTWGELQTVLSGSGISYSGMKAVIGESKVTLESGSASLPEGDFTLFLMPVKTKSGADYSNSSYREIRNAISNILADDESAKDHFNQDRNYTTKPTEELRSLLQSYVKAESNFAEEIPEISNSGEGRSDIQKLRDAIEVIANLDFSEVHEGLHEDLQDNLALVDDNYADLNRILDLSSQSSKLRQEYEDLASDFDNVRV